MVSVRAISITELHWIFRSSPTATATASASASASRSQSLRSIRSTRRRLPLILHVPAPSLLRGPVLGAGGSRCSWKSGHGGGGKGGRDGWKGGRDGGKGWLLETAGARKSNHAGFAPCKAYLIKLINNSLHRVCDFLGVCVRVSLCTCRCICVTVFGYRPQSMDPCRVIRNYCITVGRYKLLICSRAHFLRHT